jgi:hypothetical protein
LVPLGHARLAAVLLLGFGLAACSSSAAHFTTELGAPGELSTGNPVVHAGTQIGEVTGVSPLAYGSSEVGFDVQEADASLVHQDSIMVLDTQAGSLELRNPNPTSPVAAPGSRIAGASSDAEAKAIEAARGLGNYAMGLAQMLAALGPGPSAAANPGAVAPLVQQLLAIQQSVALGAYAGSPAGRQQLDVLASQLEAVQHELARQGRTVEAQKLGDEIRRLRAAAGVSSTPPNTMVAPRVYP